MRNGSPASASDPELLRRVEERIQAWQVVAERRVESGGSILVHGERRGQSIVLKIARQGNDEWRSGEVLSAFAGKGVVRVLDHSDGAVLLERLRPGESLADLAIGGDDDRATAILAEVMGRMSPGEAPSACPTIQEWGRGFERHAADGDTRIPKPLFEAARRVYAQQADSQSRARLLHGDLHHYNVLRDDAHGWVAIDPKGVVGEREYEIGASLRNPYERPELFTDPAIIERRTDRFARDLHLDAARILAWAFAQAVLAVIWAAEDGEPIRPDHPWLALAASIRPMLKGVTGA
jgi:streptomycin 6-kinase